MTNHTPQKTSGKIIGGFLGLCFGGPWGAAIGMIIGHMHDTKPQEAPDSASLWSTIGEFGRNTDQATFTMGVVVLGAKMAKTNGRVTRAEIEAFKRVFRISPSQEKAIAHLFDKARLSADGFEPYAFQLAQVFRRNKPVLEEILSGLFIIAAADYSGLSPAEVTFLKRVSFIFGFNGEDFFRIAARSGVRLAPQEKPIDPVSESCAILGVAETASGEEIKIAYRALIREHHPDKLMAQGMPPEFVATATEKMKRINVAYDLLGKIKGIK